MLEGVAFKRNQALNRVHCEFPEGEPQAAERSKACRKELAIYNGLIAELDQVMGWNIVFKEKPSSLHAADKIIADLQAPCPDEETLRKIRPVRYFKRNLYTVYERCETLPH